MLYSTEKKNYMIMYVSNVEQVPNFARGSSKLQLSPHKRSNVCIQNGLKNNTKWGIRFCNQNWKTCNSWPTARSIYIFSQATAGFRAMGLFKIHNRRVPGPRPPCNVKAYDWSWHKRKELLKLQVLLCHENK